MPISQINTNSIANGAVVPADLSTGAPSWNSSGQVGINTSNPAATLHVNGFAYFQDPNNAVFFSNGASGGYFFRKGTVSSYTDQMVIDSSGRVTTPAQPAFRVGFSSGGDASTTSGLPVPFDAKSFDTGNNFNTSTNRFVAPVAGTYLFHANIYFTRSAGDFTGGIGFMVNGSQIATTAGDGARSDANLGGDAGEMTIISINNTILLNLAANDYVQVFGINYSGAPASYRYYRGTSFFEGYLLG